jgi:hedgehog protein
MHPLFLFKTWIIQCKSVNGFRMSEFRSSLHDLLICRGWRKSCAQDVIKGDRIWTQGASNVSDDRIATDSLLYVVARISQIEKQGLYNPFTLSGTIVVNGVVASSHSDWFLDSFFQFFNLVHWLPAAYQLVLFPVRMLYYGLGKTVYITLYQRLDTLVDISKFAGKHGGGIAATVCAATGLVAILALSKVSMRSQSRRQ